LKSRLYPFCNDGAPRRHYKMDKVELKWVRRFELPTSSVAGSRSST
jgi:hypothetical protein